MGTNTREVAFVPRGANNKEEAGDLISQAFKTLRIQMGILRRQGWLDGPAGSLESMDSAGQASTPWAPATVRGAWQGARILSSEQRAPVGE